MQNPCRFILAAVESLGGCLRRAATSAFLALAIASAAQAAPAGVTRPAPVPGVATVAPVPAVQAASPKEVLEISVRNWVGKQQGLPPAQIDIAPLDPRLNVQSCRQPLAMDLPFASAETVRVRCGDPGWQLFVRVSSAARSLSQPAGSGDKAVVATRSKRRVVVAAVHLQRGTPLNESLVTLASMDADTLLPHPLEQVAQVNYVELVRDIAPGVPIRSEDVRPMILVRRGQLVQISIGQERGFQISAMVEAMQDGRMGEQIKLRNRDSGRILSGVVRGPNVVSGW